MAAQEQRVTAGATAAREPGNGPAHEKYQRLVDDCKTLPPTPTAVVHPCDQSSLQGAVDATRMGLIAPILVGPRTRIEEVAKQNRIDISGLPIVDARFSHASAEKAVDLVREGKAEALMKGSLHTDELMGAVVRRDSGLRTARRVSHCFVMDVPSYAEPLIVTDAAVNIAPTLEEKVDIIQNAIDLAHALQFPEVQGPLIDCSAEGFKQAMDISCHSFVRMARLAAPLMKNGGSMFAMSYHGANKVAPNYNVMGPVKAALEASCRYLAFELGGKGIRVHAISPGPLKTRAASSLKDFDLLLTEAAQRAPIGELVDIMDVGFTCAFLATPYARRLSGATLYVDGGVNIMA